MASAPTATITAAPPTALAASPTASPSNATLSAWWLLYAAHGDLWETNGAQTIQLTHEGHFSQPDFDGKSLVYVEREKDYSDLWLARANLAPRRVTDDASADAAASHWVAQPTLLPGGRAVDVLSDQNKATTGDGDLAIWQLDLPSGSPRQISHPPAYTGGDQDVAVNPSDPGTIVFTRYLYDENGQLSEGLVWLPADSDQTVALTTPDHPSRQASFAPDGGSLAYVQTNGHADNLYVGRVETTPQPRLVDARQVATGTIAMPVWAPDGGALAYVALTNRRFQLWTCSVTRAADGTASFGAPRQITNGDGVDAASRPVWLSSTTAASLPTWLRSTQ
jgi:hypothetical protein